MMQSSMFSVGRIAVAGFVFALSFSANAAEKKSAQEKKKAAPAATKQVAAEENLPVLNKWFALGSGCKSTPEKPGDVTIERVAESNENVHKLKFTLPKYNLTLPTEDKKSGNAFAKECAIRVNLNPPKNKRVKNISAKTALVSSKTDRTELTTYVGLKLGINTIGSALSKYEMGSTHSNKLEDVILMPGKKAEEELPVMECGEPKILGVDYTFMVRRENEEQKVHATLAADKKVELIVDLEDCK